MYKKILVCLDGTKMSERILPHAEQLALSSGSQVTLVRIVDFLVGTEVKNIKRSTACELFKNADEQAKAYLEEIAKSLTAKGIQTDYQILTTTPVGKTIVDYAKRNSYDLIALATHGYHGMDRLIIGSNAEYIIKHANIPVLLIRPEQKQGNSNT